MKKGTYPAITDGQNFWAFGVNLARDFTVEVAHYIGDNDRCVAHRYFGELFRFWPINDVAQSEHVRMPVNLKSFLDFNKASIG